MSKFKDGQKIKSVFINTKDDWIFTSGVLG